MQVEVGENRGVNTIVYSLPSLSVLEYPLLCGTWHYPSPQPVVLWVSEANNFPTFVSNTVRLHAPSIVKEALRFWLHFLCNHLHPSLAPRKILGHGSAALKHSNHNPIELDYPSLIHLGKQSYQPVLWPTALQMPVVFLHPVGSSHRSFFERQPIFFNPRDLVRKLMWSSHSQAISTWVLSP